MCDNVVDVSHHGLMWFGNYSLSFSPPTLPLQVIRVTAVELHYVPPGPISLQVDNPLVTAAQQVSAQASQYRMCKW